MVEIIPILAVFILILNFAIGFFGVIHSGILNSISARNYAFETFRNRSNLAYLRDTIASEDQFTYTKSQIRFHVTPKEGQTQENTFQATRRPIKFTEVRGVAEATGPSSHTKNNLILEGERASEKVDDVGVNPAWIKTTYGICLQASCGG